MKAFIIKYIPAHLGRNFNLRLLIFFIAFSADLFSGSSISGIIKDENNKPVPDVNIRLYPTSYGTVSDDKGEFNFSRIQEGKYKIIFEHVSFELKEVEIISKVEDRMNLTVILKSAIIVLQPIIAENSSFAVSDIVLNSRNISQYGSKNAEDILKTVSDINIENTGGSRSLISIRGTDSKHTSVYLDGVLLNSSMDGSIDLRSIPSEMIESIAIYKTGDLTLTSRSVGGIINIKTKKSGLKKEISFSYSNHLYQSDRDGISGERLNNHEFNSSVKYPLYKNTGLFLSYSRSRSENEWSYINAAKADEYRYINNPNTPRIQTNAYAYSDNYFCAFDYSFKQMQYDLGLNYSENKIGMPGWYDQPYYSAYSGKRDLILTGSAGYEKEKLYGIAFESSYNLRNDRIKIDEIDELFYVDSDDDFENYKFKLSSNYRLKQFNIKAGAEYLHESVRSRSLDRNEHGREIKSVYSKIEYNKTISEFLQLRSSGALRKDIISDSGFDKPLFSFNNSFEYKKGIVTFIPAYSYSQSYSLPSFSSLFWADNLYSSGNPDLKPEYSVQNEFSISNSIDPGEVKFRTGYSYYSKYLEDLIVWIKRTNGKYSPENFKEGRITGHEISAGADLFDGKYKADINYSRMDAKQFTDNIVTDDKFIIYKSVERLSISIGMDQWNIHTSARAEFTGKMYLNETNSIDTYPFWLFGTAVSKNFQTDNFETRIYIDCDNIFDEQYQIIYGYPMPGRKIESGIKIKF